MSHILMTLKAIFIGIFFVSMSLTLVAVEDSIEELNKNPHALVKGLKESTVDELESLFARGLSLNTLNENTDYVRDVLIVIGRDELECLLGKGMNVVDALNALNKHTNTLNILNKHTNTLNNHTNIHMLVSLFKKSNIEKLELLFARGLCLDGFHEDGFSFKLISLLKEIGAHKLEFLLNALIESPYALVALLKAANRESMEFFFARGLTLNVLNEHADAVATLFIGISIEDLEFLLKNDLNLDELNENADALATLLIGISIKRLEFLLENGLALSALNENADALATLLIGINIKKLESLLENGLTLNVLNENADALATLFIESRIKDLEFLLENGLNLKALNENADACDRLFKGILVEKFGFLLKNGLRLNESWGNYAFWFPLVFRISGGYFKGIDR